MMGKVREGNHISFAIMEFCSQLCTWNLSPFHSVNWVFLFLRSHSTFVSHVTPLSLSKNVSFTVALLFGIFLVKSMPPSIWSPHPMFKGKLRVYLCSQNNLCVSTFWFSPMVTSYSIFQNFVLSFVSSMWDSSWSSFNETIHVFFISSSRN